MGVSMGWVHVSVSVGEVVYMHCIAIEFLHLHSSCLTSVAFVRTPLHSCVHCHWAVTVIVSLFLSL